MLSPHTRDACFCSLFVYSIVVVKKPYIFPLGLSQATPSPVVFLSWEGLADPGGCRWGCNPPDLPILQICSANAQGTRCKWFGSGTTCRCQKVVGDLSLICGARDICDTPKSRCCPCRAFLSAELKLKAPSGDLDLHQLQLVLAYVPSDLMFRGGGYFSAEQGTSPVPPPPAWDGVMLSSKSHRGEWDLLHLRSASEQKAGGWWGPGGAGGLGAVPGCQLGDAGASLGTALVPSGEQILTCRFSRWVLASSPAGDQNPQPRGNSLSRAPMHRSLWEAGGDV